MKRLTFPTRQIPVSDIAKTFRSSEFEPLISIESVGGPKEKDLIPNPLMTSFIVGIDKDFRPLREEEILEFGDVFTQRFILKGINPLTLRELLDAISNLDGDNAFHRQDLFLIAEGAHFHLDRPDFALNGRLVYSWKHRSSSPVMFLSTVPNLDSPVALMQLIAWSEKDGLFHFFERRGSNWFWAGNSNHALDPRSRGKGPFDSHINGGLVFKELKLPWAHWHSQNASIPLELLDGTDFGKHPGLRQITGAERFERPVMRALTKLSKSRRQKERDAGIIAHPDIFLKQVATSQSVNLVSSAEEYSREMSGSFLRLPLTFFIDVDGLLAISRFLPGTPKFITNINTSVTPEHYLDAVDILDIGVWSIDKSARINGDTHFCFLVPERAFEDLTTMKSLIEAEWLSPRMALCIRLVDFPNPVLSQIRSSIVDNLPANPINTSKHCLDDLILEHASEPGKSVLLSYWEDSNLIIRAKGEISAYLEKIEKHMKTKQGVLDYMRLAEASRREFRKRDLHEFWSTSAHSNPEIGDLKMTQDGDVISV